MQLHDFDIALFLRDYWQKQPLLIKNPWTAWRNPLDPDELAGLACEEEVESRLITQTRATWKVEHGPFPESRFGQIGKAPWTLLVQAVDHAVPEVAALIEPFRFVPNWRIDDVMVSYATDGGGVGPHFDQYDVFLIQGLGKRRWQVGAPCDQATALLPHDDLRLLASFEATDEWVLEPGDILYVPPRVAHNGVAVGDDCMTYSIGFRAPSRSELIAHWCDHLLAEIQDDDRYDDPDLPMQDNPGEISATAIARLHAMIAEKMLDRDAFARWFGQYNSTRKYPDMDVQPEEPIGIVQLRACLADDVPLGRNPASRFSFIRQQADSLLLFVDGASFACTGESAAFAEILCAQDRIGIDPDLGKSDSAMALIVQLINQGSLAFEPED
ncbi:cupin domain-containing protein [Sphingobium aquiterrae]|uniref:cupin domain-containing protein n=1 Tax=Sphingobium aquiterrae TaxID=2038656 RepID=UPI00301A5CC8